MTIKPTDMPEKPQQTKRPKPAYQRIKDSILKNIHAGKWQAGETIPTELALADKFSVSRMTVNRALKELSEERVLERRQGSGTFVAQQQYNHTVVEVRNIAADIRATGKRYEAKVVNQQRVNIGDISPRILSMLTETMIAAKNDTDIQSEQTDESKLNKTTQLTPNDLKRNDNDVIYAIEIIHIANGNPVQFEERWVDASLVPDFIEQDFTKVNTSDYLISKAPLQGGCYTIRAVAAPPKVADALQIEAGAPTLLLSRQTYSAGRIVTFVNMWHAGSCYQLSGSL